MIWLTKKKRKETFPLISELFRTEVIQKNKSMLQILKKMVV